MMLDERRAPWIAALVMFAAAVAGMTSDPIGVFVDDGIYLLTAKAIAEGQGYVYPQLPGTPAAIHYPPLWPALLALVWKVTPAFPASVVWFKLLNPLLLAAAAAQLTRLGIRDLGLSARAALGVALLGMVSIPILVVGNLLLSEPLFLLLLVLALPASERLVREGGLRTAAVAAVLGAAVILTRTVGGVLVIATLLLLVQRRRWRVGACYAVVTFLLLLPWQIYVSRGGADFPAELQGSYGPYLEWAVAGYRSGGAPFLREVVAANLAGAWLNLSALVAAYLPPLARILPGGLALAALALGGWRLWSSDRGRVLTLALAGYLVVAMLWPFYVDRFLWIVWPLLVLLGATGLLAKADAPSSARSVLVRRGVAGGLAVGLLLHLGIGLRHDAATRNSAELAPAGIALSRAVNAHPLLRGKLIVSEMAPLVALHTGERILPSEILQVREYLHPKSVADRARELERIDRRFRPEAYIVMSGSFMDGAFRQVRLDSGRTPMEVTPAGSSVRTFLIRTP